MGAIDVFKDIGRGFEWFGRKVGSGAKEFGKGALKGVEFVADQTGHPAVQAGMAIIGVYVPVKYIALGLRAVGIVDDVADEFKKKYHRDMTDGEKQDEFAKEFRKEHPELSNGDISTLAPIFVKMKKAEDAKRAKE